MFLLLLLLLTINRENQLQEKRRTEHMLVSSAESAASTCCCCCYCVAAHPYRAAASSMRCVQDAQSLASLFEPVCQVTRWHPRSLHRPFSSRVFLLFSAASLCWDIMFCRMLVVFSSGETHWCFVRMFFCTWFFHGPEHVGDNDI